MIFMSDDERECKCMVAGVNFGMELQELRRQVKKIEMGFLPKKIDEIEDKLLVLFDEISACGFPRKDESNKPLLITKRVKEIIAQAKAGNIAKAYKEINDLETIIHDKKMDDTCVVI